MNGPIRGSRYWQYLAIGNLPASMFVPYDVQMWILGESLVRVFA
jgi:hypothetical protein